MLKQLTLITLSLDQREKDLFSLEDSVFLYDLTNTYFEGVCAGNPKAEYCKNQKEKRSDCPQVVAALVLDGDGFIRRHRMFPGKMSDAKSLKEIISAIEEDFQESQMPTIIFDRGMVSDENMNILNILQVFLKRGSRVKGVFMEELDTTNGDSARASGPFFDVFCVEEIVAQFFFGDFIG